MERLIWPDDLLDEAQVRSWIATTVPAVSTVAGPIKIEQVKSWGVVARFTVRFNDHREQEVVFKASHLPLFTYGPVVDQLLMRYCPDYAPELLGWQQWDERAWMLYRPFSAPRVSTQMSAERLSQIATTFAYLQTRIAEAPPAEVTAIPRTVVAALPTQFEAVIREIVDRQWQIWHNDEPWLLEEFQIPADLIRRLRAFTAQVARWADELASIDWPATIEHADLQADNAVLTTAGTILLFDWEEATIGCPFFSLYRLLDDARTLDTEQGWRPQTYADWYSPSELVVRQAYIKAIPWHSVPERTRAFDLAMCLAPIRAIHDGILFAAAQGWPKGIPPQVAMLSAQALRRWEALAHVTNIWPSNVNR